MDHIYLQVMKNSNVRDMPSGSSAMQPCSWSNLLSLFIYSVCTVALISSPVVDATGLFYYFFIDSQREIKKAPRFLCLEDDGLSLSRKFLASKDWPRLGAVSGKFLWSQLLGLVTWEFFTVNKADLLGVVTRMTPTIPLDHSYPPFLLTIPITPPRSCHSTSPRSCGSTMPRQGVLALLGGVIISVGLVR